MSKKLIQGLMLGLCVCTSTGLSAAVKEYHLEIAEAEVNLTGKVLKRITVNGQFPAPTLEFEEGDDAVIHVHNNLKNQDSSVHWHGLLLSGIMDGVPGFNGFNGIKPQQDYVYKFKVRQNGTYWYHAHSKGQEQDGLYGALIIQPKLKNTRPEYEKSKRDYVVMLSDFHTSTSAQILANLKKNPEFYQNQRQTVADVWKQTQQDGLKATWQDRKMWNQMRMLKTDLSDVTGYRFLVNGKTTQRNWTGLFKANEKIRLRFINASAMTFFDVRIPNLKMTVVSADGQPVQPVAVDEFRIGNAETYDVIIEPQAAHYQIEAEAIDRSGFAIGVLQNVNHQIKHTVEMPVSRPRTLLTMADMGHHSAGADHSKMGHDSMPEMDHSKMSHDSMLEMNHSKMGHDPMPEMNHSKMSVDPIPEMDHTQINPTAMPQTGSDSTKNDAHNSASVPHPNHVKTTSNALANQKVEGWANASTPTGHKALQYRDLKALHPQTDIRPAERELVIHLGGNMQRYIWTINGKKFTDAEALQVKFGERVRLTFINDSMMAHPMHLHGMFMQLENGQKIEDLPNKHTIVVPPGQSVSALLTADELGEWAIHCHLLYHMSSGMMTKLVVANVASDSVSQSTGAQHEHH